MAASRKTDTKRIKKKNYRQLKFLEYIMRKHELVYFTLTQRIESRESNRVMCKWMAYSYLEWWPRVNHCLNKKYSYSLIPIVIDIFILSFNPRRFQSSWSVIFSVHTMYTYVLNCYSVFFFIFKYILSVHIHQCHLKCS